MVPAVMSGQGHPVIGIQFGSGWLQHLFQHHSHFQWKLRLFLFADYNFQAQNFEASPVAVSFDIMDPHRPTDQVVVPSRATKGFEGEGERQNTNNGRQLSPATNSLHHHDPSPSLVLLLGGIISVTATGSPFHSKIIIVILISPFVSPLISIHLRGTKERQLQRVIFTAAGVILSADSIFPNDWQRKNIADQKTKLKAAKFS